MAGVGLRCIGCGDGENVVNPAAWTSTTSWIGETRKTAWAGGNVSGSSSGEVVAMIHKKG